jgi:uncharacterized protein YdhG (YjbR/CyaY superfamily)
MSSQEVDQYLAGVKEPQHSTLQHLRKQLLALIPDAEECISYAMPCIKVKGKAVAGYAAFKNHIGYFPHSGSVVPKLEKELAGRKQTTGGFQFGNDERLEDSLVKKLVETRMQDIRERYPDIEF